MFFSFLFFYENQVTIFFAKYALLTTNSTHTSERVKENFPDSMSMTITSVPLINNHNSIYVHNLALRSINQNT